MLDYLRYILYVKLRLRCEHEFIKNVGVNNLYFYVDNLSYFTFLYEIIL